ncbi:MAG: hypothetical protein GF416_07845 [Candidatus Altiarchaeales archaeon]|nr:hypothetical protein [Candidatus Altiarchaeales archaeon]MBD3417025.1 hypothetical protein [Candidatus Altiarchaeales archaeon]
MKEMEKFKVEDKGLLDELKFWGLKEDEILRESLEYIMWATIRRRTDNRCRTCKKVVKSTVPPEMQVKNSYPDGFCECD